MKWYGASRLQYEFIVMEGCSKDVFFHFNDVHSGEEFTLKDGDDVTFIFNDMEIAVQMSNGITNPSMIH